MRLRELLFCRVFLTAALLLCSAATAFAQSTIHVCGANLNIGMTKARTLDITGADCKLNSLRTSDSGPDLWCAKETPAKLAVASKDCHILEFKDGFLTFVIRQVAVAHDNASGEIVNLIYVFLDTASSEGKSVTVGPRKELESDGWRYRIVLFKAGERTLILTTTQAIGGAQATSRVSLEESLEAVRSPKQ